MKTEQLTSVEEIAASKQNDLQTLFQHLNEKMPKQECWQASGPKTFDKNWEKGWNKDGH